LLQNSIKLGLGVGLSSGFNTDGWGLLYSVGYQRELGSDRFGLNANFGIGQYTSKMVLDARDQYFNSTNLDLIFFYDLIKIKSFSIVIGGGGFVNNSRGLIGTGGDPESNPSVQQTSEYVSNYHVGGYLGAGFRINVLNERTAVNIIPFNFRFGNNYFAELNVKIELDIKF